MTGASMRDVWAMVWRRVLCAVAVTAFPLIGWAQTIAVQSGEHDGFTRLVLDIGAERDWRLERLADRQGSTPVVRLVLDPPVQGFDISRTFDLIPRSRLTDLVVRDGLELGLGCPCEIAAERFRDRYLVLDIRPGVLDVPWATPRAPARIAAPGPLPDTARLLLEARMGRNPGAPGTPPTLAEAPAPPRIDLEQAGQIMAEQLARAAAAGLLVASTDRPMTDADPRDPTVPSPPPAAEEDSFPDADADADELVLPLLPPLRAGTVLDLTMPQRIAVTAPRDPLGCMGTLLPLAEWSMGETLQDGLGPLRLNLFDERDQLIRDSVTQLARHYLAFGFGAEAEFWLSQIDAPPPVLLALARMLDDRPGPHFPPESDPASCSDDEVLWRYLDGSLPAEAIASQDAIRLQRAFSALPVLLFDHLAPRMLRMLHADGFANEARNLRDMLWRSGRLPQAVLLRVDRDLGLSQGDAVATRAALAEALGNSGGDPVSALVHAMAFDRETGMPVNTTHLEAGEALLRENGITPATTPLWQEVMLAHAATGDLEPVLALFGADGVAAADRDTALTALLAAALARQDTPAVFLLARLFGAEWQAEGSEAGRIRVAAIARLRDAGLTQAAEALRLGQRVLILPSDPAPAPAPEDVLRSAWHSGDWAGLDAMADGPHRAIALRMEGAVADEPQATDPERLVRDLPRLAQQLEDSRVLREEIGALLAAPSPALSPEGEVP